VVAAGTYPTTGPLSFGGTGVALRSGAAMFRPPKPDADCGTSRPSTT